MARTRGSKNADHDERKTMLLERLRARLGREGATHASWRELAASAEVGLSTMTHYFGRREDVVRAIMEDDLRLSEVYLVAMRAPLDDFDASIREAVQMMVDGFVQGGVTEVFASGLVQSLRHPTLGPAFLDFVLDPTTDAVAERLQAHIDRGHMRPCEARVAAVQIIAPLLVAYLHQAELGGERHKPVDLDRFVEQHAETMVRAFRAGS